MQAAEQRQRQDAIIVALVLALRRLIGARGIPATDEQRAVLARVLFAPVQHARQQSYALAVTQMRQEAALAGFDPPTPAPLREYRHQALVTLLEEATQAAVEIERDLDEAPRATVTVAPEDPPRRSGTRVTVDELDDNSRNTARRKLREPVTEDNRWDPQVVDVVTRRITQAASRHAEMAGRHMLMDTVEQAEPLRRRRTSVSVDEAPTRPERRRDVTVAERREPRRARDRSHNRRRPREEPAEGAVIGWARILTGRESCGFCAMLASRGPVYRSQATASSTAAGRAFHRNCDCIARAIFKGRDWEGREEYERLEKIWITSTVNHSGADARKAFTQAFLEARTQNPDQFVPASMRGEQPPDSSVELDDQ
ncbi:hypothetical protein [Rhodococcus pyridinivorans]|uniref:VG15 protein n=1 Tax=Rhodococcus pyridinivorans TaxID=103816 RepID=UPI003AAFCC33